MKVMEKATDRRAEVHIYVDGEVDARREYGEYIDTKDKAICCYVPVEEGHQIKVGGKFSGTTLTIAYDAVVDGVLRKAGVYSAQTVRYQKNKKLDIEKFLFEVSQGIIETNMLVTPIVGVAATLGEELGTVGTMELRLYITRQLDVTCSIDGIEKYHNTNRSVEDEGSCCVTYKLLPPTFYMTFDKNSATLDRAKASREKRKADANRPGMEPWAIFRFHYRSREAINERGMKMSYDPTSKAKTEPHTLAIEQVPPLFVDTKLDINDGDSSTQTTSPMAPDVPSTPNKDRLNGPFAKSPTRHKQPLTHQATTPAHIPKMDTITANKLTRSPEGIPSTETYEDVDEDLRLRIFSKPLPKPLSTKTPVITTDRTVTNDDADSALLPSTLNSKTNRISIIPKDKNVTGIAQISATKKTVGRPVGNLTKSSAKKTQPTASDKIIVASPMNKPVASVDDSIVKGSSLHSSDTNVINGTTMNVMAPTKDTIKKVFQVLIQPTEEPSTKPASIACMTPITPKKPAEATPPVTPTKRVPEPMNDTTPDIKRTKITTTLPVPTIPTKVSCIPPSTPSPRPISVERKVAEQRKKLEVLRQKRFETAQKQQELDKRMAPFRERMAKELERLNQEMMEEEAAAAEDEEHLSASVQMWEEFKNTDGGC